MGSGGMDKALVTAWGGRKKSFCALELDERYHSTVQSLLQKHPCSEQSMSRAMLGHVCEAPVGFLRRALVLVTEQDLKTKPKTQITFVFR